MNLLTSTYSQNSFIMEDTRIPLTTHDQHIIDSHHMEQRKQQKKQQFKYEPINMHRPNIWMQQMDKSGNEYTPFWQIARAFGILIGFIVWVYLMMWLISNGGLAL